jgi:MmyB-like transcription regulator ligand binding domain
MGVPGGAGAGGEVDAAAGHPGRLGLADVDGVDIDVAGVKHFRHPAVGLLDLMFEAMALEADEGLTLTAYTAEPGTPSHDGLKLLAS